MLLFFFVPSRAFCLCAISRCDQERIERQSLVNFCFYHNPFKVLQTELFPSSSFLSRPNQHPKPETNPLSTLLEEQFSSRPRNTNNGNSRLSDNFGWLNHKPNRHQHHANQATTSSSVEARQAIMKLPNSNSNSNSNSDVTLEEFLTESGQTSNPTSGATTTTTTTVSDNSSTSGWTKSMWPQHLLTGITTTSQQDNFSQPATQLIQWTILIGSLLSLILLIMLILRKLFVSTFPSYQWMLAKQTLKSTSKLNHHHQTATPDCCQASSYSRGGQQRHLTGSVMPACVTVNPSSGLFGFKSRQHQHHLHFQQANLAKNQLPPHHMCHAWRQQQAANVEGGSNSGKQIRQATIGQSYTVLNANGNHILSSSFAPTFNTDIYDLPGSFAQESARSMTNSSSASYKPRMNNNNNSLELLENEVHSVISANYNYDTLNSNYGNGVEQHTCKEEDKGFQLSRNYARQELSSFANLTNGGTELAGKRHLNGSLHCNEEPDSSLVGIKKEKKKQRQEKGEFKHGPKVPRRARGQVGDLGRQSSSASSTISGSSQSQSGCDSSLASGSVQSTTAQMISQAASCSFEPEQTSQLELNSGDLQTNINNNGSSISPAISLLGHGASRIVRNGSTKLTGCPSSVQSQPNSPMFANQFTVAKLRQQTGRDLSLPAPNLSSASRLSSLSQTNNKEQDQIDTANHKFEQEQQQQSDIPEQTKHQEAVSGESHCGPGTTNEKQLIIDGFNPKRETLNVTAGNNNNNNIDYCDNQDERHLYEEITNQDQAS